MVERQVTGIRTVSKSTQNPSKFAEHRYAFVRFEPWDPIYKGFFR
jgi:hypothetical protein